jgi:phosphotransferase system enzyme I (PtsP)
MAQRQKLGVTTLEDINTLILQSHDLIETLRNIVALIQRRMRTEVCSIYLLDSDGATLRLRASKGLAKRSIGRVSMKIGEGLTGMVVQEGRAVTIQDPENDPRFRYFKETGEEKYHSFLGIPLFERKQPLGVIVLQTKETREFSADEISTLTAIALQISSVVVNARLLDRINQQEAEADRVKRELAATRQRLADTQENDQESSSLAMRGHVAYPGVVSGLANILEERLGFADILDEKDIDPIEETRRLDNALEETRIQTLFLEKKMAERMSEQESSIFHTHLMILEDRGFIDRLYVGIKKGHSAPYMLEKVVSGFIEAFERMDDPYLRERAADMEDIGRRLLANLIGKGDQGLQLKHAGILVARQILPSDMAALDHTQITGIVTESGEKNSHAVIMAKSLGIPALVGVKGALKNIEPDDMLILDANSGSLYINPGATILEEYSRLQEDQSREQSRLDEYRDQPALTADGVEITLRANVGLVSDVPIALRNGAKGVGLYRTEFPYMARGGFPDRNDQYLLYRKVIEGFDGQPVTIRTLDIGGDKKLPYFNHPPEENPFMGWRSVRVSLDNRDIFRTQIEAILMASIHGPVKLLFPMISSLDELRECKAVVSEARANLERELIPCAPDIPLGIMIEVPAAVMLINRLACEVDFFALGTNDLIQYLLAADRNNPLVSKYYDPLHPAVLRVLNDVNTTAASLDKGVCVCGEMSSDPINLIPMVGMGISEFSTPAPFIPRTKAFLKKLPMETARRAAKEVLQMDSAIEIRQYLKDLVARLHSNA